MFIKGSGCEVQGFIEFGPDAHGSGAPTGSVTRDTSFPVSGVAAWKFDSTGGSGTAFNEMDSPFGFSTSTTVYARIWMRFEDLPDSTVIVMQHGSPVDTTNGLAIKLTSAGKLQLWNLVANTQIGSDSTATVSTGVYHYLEMGDDISSGSSLTVTGAEARFNGETFASTSGVSISPCNQSISFGWRESPGANKVIYADDYVMYDSAGSFNNTWVGPEPKVIWMKPTSDAQVGSWTGGAGGVSNLFEAVNNTPPAGLASASATNTSQIETSDSSGNNSTDEYRGNCGSYIDAGLVETDTVNGITVWANHGEDINTNTKTGSVGMQSNPASSSYQTFTYGDDFGAVGTWNAQWVWTGSSGVNNTIFDQPSVVLEDDAIIAVRKTDAGTRVAAIDCLGLYVVYTPEAVPEPSPLMWYTTL